MSCHQQVVTNSTPFLLLQIFQLPSALDFPITSISHYYILPHYLISLHMLRQTQTLVRLLPILHNFLFYFLDNLDFFIHFIQHQILLLKIEYLKWIHHEMNDHQLLLPSSPKHMHHVSIGIHTYSHSIINFIMN